MPWARTDHRCRIGFPPSSRRLETRRACPRIRISASLFRPQLAIGAALQNDRRIVLLTLGLDASVAAVAVFLRQELCGGLGLLGASGGAIGRQDHVLGAHVALLLLGV